MKKLIQHICQLLENHHDFVLATIVSQIGSTPRAAGTQMVVHTDGTIEGTIGGGIVEASVIETAKDVFNTKTAGLHAFDLAQNRIGSMDMICGGKLDVLIEHVAATAENRSVFKALHGVLEKGRPALLITDMETAVEENGRPERCLVTEGGIREGTWRHAASMLERILKKSARARYPYLLTLSDHSFFIEPCFVPGTVFLFGAGHVSRQLATLTTMVGFRTVVLDDRGEFANAQRFPTADEIRVLDSFDDCFQSLDIDEDSYLVIVTRGHLYDKIVLGQALKTHAGYIGMIGSKSKRKDIYRALTAEGVTPEALQKVHSPVGLPIKAETPEEIAVSIIAELIQTRVELRQ